MELKNITNVTVKETPEENDKFIIESGGHVKRLPVSAIGGGSGAGVDLIFTATAAPEDGSGGDDTVWFAVDTESVELETSLTFDDLVAKWFYFTLIFGLDCKDSGYRGLSNSDLFMCSNNFMSGEMSYPMAWTNLSAEMVSMFEEMGVTVSEGDAAFTINMSFAQENIEPIESGEGSDVYAESSIILLIYRGNNDQIAFTVVNNH